MGTHRSRRRRSPSTDSEYSGSDGGDSQTRRKKLLSSKTVTEDDIAQYLAKRAKKKALRNAKKLKTTTLTGYSNDGNPFGDPNLNEAFVWGKKIEWDVSHGVPLDVFSLKSEKKRQRERIEEIEKVKRRREQRAIERAQREEEARFLALERAKADLEDCEKKEEEFEFEQSQIRSEIRFLKGRMLPIDVLSGQINGEFGFIEVNDPCMFFKGLTLEELEQLREDIRMHLNFDRSNPNPNPRRVEYWESLLVVCDWEIAEIRKKSALKLLAEEKRMDLSVEAEVRNLLEGKSYRELEELESEIESDMSLGKAKVVEFWQVVLQRLRIYKAKAFLKEIRTKMSRKLVPEQQSLSPRNDDDAHEEVAEEDDGPYSPPLFHGGDDGEEEEEEEEEEAIDPEADTNALERQPKYFKRVHTGYEWNKYNQTHYDQDNPPPKVVQGYKFDIFYPDLVDKTITPTYTIEKDGEGSADTCIIRFHGGPPYEDITFRIVNEEWECSRKKGFKCTFEHGTLRLYFNLKRYRYRR